MLSYINYACYRIFEAQLSLKLCAGTADVQEGIWYHSP